MEDYKRKHNCLSNWLCMHIYNLNMSGKNKMGQTWEQGGVFDAEDQLSMCPKSVFRILEIIIPNIWPHNLKILTYNGTVTFVGLNYKFNQSSILSAERESHWVRSLNTSSGDWISFPVFHQANHHS
jgi:hypothetical protein